MSDHASNDRDDLPRQVDLAIVRVDPWGVMKVAFLLSVALGYRTGRCSHDPVAHAQRHACLRLSGKLPAVHWRIADGLALGLRQASEGHGLHDSHCGHERCSADCTVGLGNLPVQLGRLAGRWHQGDTDG